MSSNNLIFLGNSFCFTGTMSGLKRTQAEREVRARGGLTCDVVNERLTYLVVGDIPSPGWKHGDYGRKIEKARNLASQTSGLPKLVPEGAFMEALGAQPPTNSGVIDAKVFVCNYKFLTPSIEHIDVVAVEELLTDLQQNESCHVALRSHYATAYSQLFEGGDANLSKTALVVECRIVKQMLLTDDPAAFVERIERGFEAIRGVDGRLHWFERAEGSADYIRLLQSVPQSLRLVEQ
jgi:hypothetical protein